MVSTLLHTPTTITAIADVEDELLNSMATSLGSWDAEVKLYRANSASFGPSPGKVLYTVYLSHCPEKLFVFGPSSSAVLEGEAAAILESRMKSLWLLRQTFKGEGRAFQLVDGGEVRIANIFVQGNYKGFIADVSYPNLHDISVFKEKVHSLVQNWIFPEEALRNFDVVASECDAAKQYEKLSS